MKKLVLVLLLIPLVSFGQDESTINLNVKQGVFKNAGLISLGSGKYIVKQQGATYFISSRKLEKKARETMSNI
ncbi:hypothetical protein N9591_03370 [Flavobacteriaceae bacterium]|nr:hypothetical protein [Flavobacteriaceae bacterium]